MSNWKTARLGDILNFKRGHDLPKYDMKDGKIPVAGSNGIIGYHNVATNISPCITIGRSGNVGTPYMYEKCWAHNTTLYIDDYKENDPQYIFYLLKTLNLSNYGGGSAVPTLNRNHIHPIYVFYTSDLEEQKRIAGILGALDDKIECNNRINLNLEEQATALFRRWFVDFEFPNSNGNPYRTSGGTFTDSPLGKIPTGWQVKPMSEVSNINAGGDKPKMYSNSPIDNCNIPIYSNGIDDFGLYGYTDVAKILEESVTISARGTIGFVCLRQKPYLPIVRLISITPNTKVLSAKYLYIWAKSQNINGTGTTQLQLTVPDFRKTEIIMPVPKIMQDFTCFANALFENIEANREENQTLATLRNTLLPKLMNNEIK